MKNLILIALVVIACGCSKKSDIHPISLLSTQDSTFKTLLLGKWNGVYFDVTYTDSITNKPMTVLSPTIVPSGTYYYTFFQNSVKKSFTFTGNPQLFSDYNNGTYTITNTGNETFININPNDGDPVENWQIITLNSSSLVLHRSLPTFEDWNNLTNTGYKGYNAIFDEQYSK